MFRPCVCAVRRCQDPRSSPATMMSCHEPSVKLLMASTFRCLDRNANVTSGDPSRIIRCTVIKLLKTMVHVESCNRYWSARKTSPIPASPEWVATRMCSIYFVFGGAFCETKKELASSKRPTGEGCPGLEPAVRAYLYLGRALDGLLEGARHCSSFQGASWIDGTTRREDSRPTWQLDDTGGRKKKDVGAGSWRSCGNKLSSGSGTGQGPVPRGWVRCGVERRLAWGVIRLRGTCWMSGGAAVQRVLF